MKIALFTTLLLASAPTLAVVNGTPVNWSSQDDTVRLDASDNASKYCTATMIAGRYALTAAHCFASESGIDNALTAAAQSHALSDIIYHPNFVYKEDSLSTEDVALAVLDDALDYRHIHFLNVDELTEAEPVSISGFGGTKESLNRADFTYSHSYFWYDFLLYLDMVNDSHTTGGDSGSAWLNEYGEVIAVHTGSKNFFENGRETYGTDLTYAADFILETIDGWHYPTLATANGKTEITVQSLHVNGAVDTAYTDGDAMLVVDESTCITNSVSPFDTCTYVIESEGGEGTLYLSSDEAIKINAVTATPPQEGESSGGSLGLGSLLLLAGFAWRRQSKKSPQH